MSIFPTSSRIKSIFNGSWFMLFVAMPSKPRKRCQKRDSGNTASPASDPLVAYPELFWQVVSEVFLWLVHIMKGRMIDMLLFSFPRMNDELDQLWVSTVKKNWNLKSRQSRPGTWVVYEESSGSDIPPKSELGHQSSNMTFQDFSGTEGPKIHRSVSHMSAARRKPHPAQVLICLILFSTYHSAQFRCFLGVAALHNPHSIKIQIRSLKASYLRSSLSGYTFRHSPLQFRRIPRQTVREWPMKDAEEIKADCWEWWKR